MRDVRENIFKNSFLWILSFLFQQLLRFIIVYLIARFFGKSVFGAYSLSLTFVAFFGLISRFGWEYSFVKYIQHYLVKKRFGNLKGLIKSGFLFSLIFSLIISLILILKSDFFIKVFYKNSHGIFFYLVILFFPIQVLLQLSFFVVEGLKFSGLRAFLDRFCITFLHLIIFLILFKFVGSISTILSYFLSIFLMLLISIYVVSNIFKIEGIKEDFLKSKTLFNFKSEFKYGINLFFDAFISFLLSRTDIIFLSFFVALGDVGVYSLTTRLTMLLILFYFAFESILTPTVSEYFSKNDFNGIKNLYKEITWWGIGFTLPLAIFYFVSGKELLNFFGKDFSVGYKALLILTFAQLINVIVGSAGNILAVCGYSKLSLYNSITVAFFSVILYLTLIPRYGIVGVALGTGISIGILNLLRLLEIFSIFKLHPFNSSYLVVLFAGIFSLFVGYLVKPMFCTLILKILSVAFSILISYMLIFILFMPEENKSFLKDFLKSLGWRK